MRALRERGDDVRALCVRRGRAQDNLADLDCERATGDVLDRRSVRRALSDVDRVFHVAGRTSLRMPAADLYRVNVDGTRIVLEECLRAGVERVVYTSSVAAIGPARRGSTADESQVFDAGALRHPLRQRQARGRGPGAAARRPGAAGGDRQPRARVRARRPQPLLDRASCAASCAARSPPTSTAPLNIVDAARRRPRPPGGRRARQARRALHPRQPQLHARPPVRRPRADLGRRAAGGEAAAARRARLRRGAGAAARAAGDHAGRGPRRCAVVGVSQHQGQARAGLEALAARGRDRGDGRLVPRARGRGAGPARRAPAGSAARRRVRCAKQWAASSGGCT